MIKNILTIKKGHSKLQSTFLSNWKHTTWQPSLIVWFQIFSDLNKTGCLALPVSTLQYPLLHRMIFTSHILFFVLFLSLLEESEDKGHGHNLLSSLLLFITGTTIMDSDLKVDVVFQSNPTKPLLEADSCFSRLTVPTCHSSYEEFKKACTLSIKNGALGYGRF